MIIGLILGDGTLVRKKGNTYFQYTLIHIAYIHIFLIYLLILIIVILLKK